MRGCVPSTGTKNFPNFPHSGTVRYTTSRAREPSPRAEPPPPPPPFINEKSRADDLLPKSDKSIHNPQTTRRQPIECAPEASSGGREWAEMTEGFHLEATRRKVLTYVPSGKK